MDSNSPDVTQLRQNSIRLSTVATTTRQTPKTDFGTVMRDGLVKAGSVAADGLAVAAPFVPGGAIVSAALAGGQQVATDAGAFRGAPVMTGPSYAGSGGAGGVTYGLSTSALTAPGAGPAGGGSAAIGNYTPGGSLALPGTGPNLGSNLSSGGTGFGSAMGGTGFGTAGSSDAFNQMMGATQQMTEFQASFNLQYLQLQEKIQIDSRQFNLVSNIMKTKNDAAKNALNNVR